MRRRSAIRALALLLPAAVLALALLGCEKKEEAKPAPVVPVAVAPVTQEDIPVTVEGLGTVEALHSATIRAQVTGYLKERPEREGVMVKAGQQLFVIDPEPFQQKARQLQAQVSQAVSQDNQNVRDHDRYKVLVEQGVVSKEEYEQKRLAMVTGKEQITGNQAALAQAQTDLKHCYISSPLDGLMGKIAPKKGDLITANQDVLTTINEISPIAVNLYVPEQYVPKIRAKMAERELKMEAVLQEEPNKPAEIGELIFLDNNVDPKTGMVWLQGKFKNENSRLWPGRYVKARLDLKKDRGALLLPKQAVNSGPNGSYVWVVGANMTATMRPIKVVREYGPSAVVHEGLTAGEQVVIDGQLRLSPGAKVAVQGAPAAPQEGAKP